MATSLLKRVTGEPVSKVEIMVSCDKLLNKDVTSKSDPCCLLYMQTNNSWFEVGRTERINNCLNPKFARSFELDYYFEEVQRMCFKVYDLDNNTPQVSDDDFLGQIECTLGEVVSGSPFTRQLMLKGSSKAGSGTITLQAQEIGKLNEILHMTFSAQNLDNKDFMGKSDPYLEFNRMMPGGGYQTLLRTEVIKNNLNPSWRPIDVKVSRLCCSDLNAQLKVDCFDHDSDGSHDLIGSFTTTTAELMQGATKQLQWPCINPKKVGKKKYQNSGIVHLKSCTVTKVHSFLDFIFGGLQINFTVSSLVGIDFTASNGNPSNPSSLHFINPYQPNMYMNAIQNVGMVIQDYDRMINREGETDTGSLERATIGKRQLFATEYLLQNLRDAIKRIIASHASWACDQMFPALGYGAKIPPQMEVSHCFALNFNAANPFCTGIQGVLDAYRMCISQIQLHGPTNFAPIILHVAQFAAAAKKENNAKNYFVLLIITDGVISDMADTVSAIVYASTLPFSIIIVGVGPADFAAMDALDCDTGMLRDRNGYVAQRDIVQFVPFRNFINAPPAALAKQVLAEVPDQVCRYYQLNNTPPGVPVAAAPVQPGGQLPASAPPAGPGFFAQLVPGAQPQPGTGPVPHYVGHAQPKV